MIDGHCEIRVKFNFHPFFHLNHFNLKLYSHVVHFVHCYAKRDSILLKTVNIVEKTPNSRTPVLGIRDRNQKAKLGAILITKTKRKIQSETLRQHWWSRAEVKRVRLIKCETFYLKIPRCARSVQENTCNCNVIWNNIPN